MMIYLGLTIVAIACIVAYLIAGGYFAASLMLLGGSFIWIGCERIDNEL